MIQPNAQLADQITLIARAAGELIMARYQAGFEVLVKADDSPVTIADQEANDYIVSALIALTPDTPIIAEESVTGEETPESLPEFWLVDPLDGTKEFINRNGDFTVNIALIQHGTPTLGVVHPPVHGTAYISTGEGEALFEDVEGARSVIKARPMQVDRPVALVSRSHRSPETDQFLERFERFEAISRGSSLKFCTLAAGEADLYPRFGRTMEWDTAAGHAVLIAAGGRVETLDEAPLRYGKRGLENPHFVAWGALPHGAS